MPELLLILGLAFVILGPQNPSKFAGKLGKAYAEFKRANGALTSQIVTEIKNIESPVPSNSPAPVQPAESCSLPAAPDIESEHLRPPSGFNSPMHYPDPESPLMLATSKGKTA